MTPCHISNIAFQSAKKMYWAWDDKNKTEILYYKTLVLPFSLLYRMRDEVKKTTNEEDGEEDKIISEIEEEQVSFYEKEK